MNVEQALQRSGLFGSLDGPARARLAGRMTTRSFDAGTMILRQGSSAVTLYLILEGEVQVVREAEDGTARTTVAMLGVGDVFGEMALLDDEARSSSVTATTLTRCALLSRWEFQQELRRQPDLAIALLRTLSRRVRDLDERLSRLSGPTNDTPAVVAAARNATS